MPGARHWTAEEINSLHKLYLQGITIKMLARVFKRTPQSVSQIIYRNGWKRTKPDHKGLHRVTLSLTDSQMAYLREQARKYHHGTPAKAARGLIDSALVDHTYSVPVSLSDLRSPKN